MVLFESFGADQDGGVIAVVAAAAVIVAASATSWGLVLFVLLNFLELVLGLEGSSFGIVRSGEVGV
jgi:hypothetical protein